MRDRVALVTGAGAGIGRASVLHLVRAGATVLACDVDEEGVAGTVAAARAEGGTVVGRVVDVGEPAGVRDAVAFAVRELGGPHFALNNAGISGRPYLLHDMPLDEWDRVLSVNLAGTFHCMKYELAHMAAQRFGAIVNTASTAALIGATGLAAYTATKHGVLGLTRTAAVDYAALNIRVNAICPGPTLTPMLAGLMDESPERRAAMEGASPAGRLGTVDEVAATAVFLCSDAAAYVNGVALPVDGARTAGPVGARPPGRA